MCSQRGNVPGAESFAVDLHDIQQDFGCLVHALYGGALAHAVEVEAAGAQVGAGQALPAQGGTISAAAPAFSMALRAFSTRWKWGLIFSSMLR